jgi:hypothetical protein
VVSEPTSRKPGLDFYTCSSCFSALCYIACVEFLIQKL